MYLILKGTVNVYDDNLNLINYFEKNEILGLNDFIDYFKLKYKVDIQSIMTKLFD